MFRPPLPAFSLFAPPYREFIPLCDEESFPTTLRVLRGVALVWNLDAGHAPHALERAANRPGGVPLMVILPPASKVRRLEAGILAIVEEARPQSVLPHHPKPDPGEMAWLLADEPECLASEVLDFLVWRGMHFDKETRRVLLRTLELAPDISTLSALARGVYLSRRALGRRFQQRGLPVPSHWLQFSRILHAAVRLQSSERSVSDIALALGYPDGFTLSNQMERLVGVRPSFVRDRLGWEWLVEAWLQREWMEGGMRVELVGFPRAPLGGMMPEAMSSRSALPSLEQRESSEVAA